MYQIHCALHQKLAPHCESTPIKNLKLNKKSHSWVFMEREQKPWREKMHAPLCSQLRSLRWPEHSVRREMSMWRRHVHAAGSSPCWWLIRVSVDKRLVSFKGWTFSSKNGNSKNGVSQAVVLFLKDAKTEAFRSKKKKSCWWKLLVEALGCPERPALELLAVCGPCARRG